MFKEVTIEELKVLLESGNCQLIDVREEGEYKKVRIPGSKLAPLSEFDKKCNIIDKTKSVYLHCGVGGRARKAAEYLTTIGYEDVYVVNGGMKAWLEAGYKTQED